MLGGLGAAHGAWHRTPAATKSVSGAGSLRAETEAAEQLRVATANAEELLAKAKQEAEKLQADAARLLTEAAGPTPGPAARHRTP